MTRRYKKKRKPKIYLLLIPVVLIVALLILIIQLENKLILDEDDGYEVESTSTPEPTNDPSVDSELDVLETVEPTVTVEPTATSEPFESTWNLILVNYENPLPDDFEVELVSYGEKYVDERIYDALSDMISDCGKAGGTLWVASAYRSVETQESVLSKAVANRMSDYGMTEEEATENALLTIAQPGYSEHHTALAVDFNYVNSAFEDTVAYEWLSENAMYYGFILRYPEDKEDITQISYEPWHYRYVGVEAAIEMNELGFCLEEYIEYLGG
ncbi:MAG: M15 family metallopeptidase [Clostridia bacterium]